MRQLTRILEGGSLRAIAKDWNERGIRTTWDKEINETGLKKMLTSPRIAGYSQHRGQIIGKGKWDPILDEATWKQVAYDPQRPGYGVVRDPAGVTRFVVF